MADPLKPLTPNEPLTERDRIRNLIDQFAAGYHTADEMPGLILATLDAERAARPDNGLPVLDEAYGKTPTYEVAGRCLTCGARFIVRREKGVKPPLSVDCPHCGCTEFGWQDLHYPLAPAQPAPSGLAIDEAGYQAGYHAAERAWPHVIAARGAGAEAPVSGSTSYSRPDDRDVTLGCDFPCDRCHSGSFAPASAPDAERLREAAQAVVDAWDRYQEAHAGRGHEGEHDESTVLDGGCLGCAGAQYGTEVEMSEYVIPALRDALAALGKEPNP